jgi:uncharacterized protein (DUF2141 family)
MYKTILTAFSVSLFIFFSSFKQQGNTTLKVEVSLEKSIQTKSVVVSGSKVIVEFDLPPGEYAVSTYQDENNNGKLDRYIIGKPKEPYGFSNNVKPFGPPSYKSCKFTLGNTPKLISISLIN